MRSKLEYFTSRKVFSPVETIPKGVSPVGCKWAFVRKQDHLGNVSQFKTLLVAHGFTKCPCIDYEETYSFVMDSTIFRYLLSLVVDKKLKTRLMDVVTVYLYGSLDTDIYMRIPAGLVEFQNSQRHPQ